MYKVIIGCLAAAVFQNVLCADKTLVMVHLVYRHGARSPIHFFPTDKHKNDWPVDPGMLTKIGMNLEYELGKFLKQRYMEDNKLVNQKYIQKQVYIRSSDSPRCLQSAETQLAGLYPPKGDQIWNEEIKTWQPIPVHTVRPDKDPVLRPDDTPCPRLDEFWEAKTKEPEYVEKEKKNQGLLNALTNFIGMTVNFSNFWQVYDVIKCEETQNFSLPSWYPPIKNAMVSLGDWLFLNKYVAKDDEFAKLLGGVLLGIIDNNMKMFSEGKLLDKLYPLMIFSGHDTSILALTATLGIAIPVPPFASCLMVELYKDGSGKFFVELQFRNDSSGNVYPLQLLECNHSCPIEDFLRYMSPRTTDKRECTAIHQPINKSTFSVLRLKVALAVFIVIALVLMIVVFVLLRSKRSQSKRISSYRTEVNDDEFSGLVQ